MIVVDTNVVAYLLLGGERTQEVRGVFRRDPAWAAPLLWRSEFRNVLVGCLRRGALALPDALDVMRDAETLLRGSEYGVASDRILKLAGESGCTAYDCEFVALAQQLGVPLVTSDTQILKAFPRTAVTPGNY